MAKLSIITINFNHAFGLERTIKSVINQTNRDFEYIVIDGASTDDSTFILKKYSKEIDICISEPDNGIYNAMNKGIKIAKGEYILFLNSGDNFYSNNTLYNCIENLNDAHLIYGNLHRIFPDKTEDFVEMPHHLNFYTFFYGTIAHPASFIKKSLFDEFGLYKEDLKIISDWAFFLKIFTYSNITSKYIPQTISTFYMDGVSSVQGNLINEEKQKVYTEYFSSEVFNILNGYNFYLNFYNSRSAKKMRLVSRYVKNLFSLKSWTEFIHKRRYNKLIRLVNKEVRNQLKNPLSIPIIIINYNRLRDLKKLISSLLEYGHKNIVLIDNNSSYEPLLEYYETIKEEVIIERMCDNYGHLVLWKNKQLLEKYGKGYYVVTDSDISLNEKLPVDYISYLRKILDKNRNTTKVGFALDICDIPDYYILKEKVVKWESQYWNNNFKNNLYRAHIDTTFALYPPYYKYNKFNFYEGIRVGGNFMSKHMGWYIDANNLDEEDLFYFKTSNSSNTWKLSEKNGITKESDLYK